MITRWRERRTARALARAARYQGLRGWVLVAALGKALVPLGAAMSLCAASGETPVLLAAGFTVLAIGFAAWLGIALLLSRWSGLRFLRTTWDIWLVPTWWSVLDLASDVC